MLGLPVIQTLGDFSKFTHVSKYSIYRLSKYADKYYKTYTIPKKSGEPRVISQPSKKLKGIQSWILVNILNKLKVSNSCKGFEKNSSTCDNVRPHVGANIVLTIDLEDFFHSVKRNHVYSIFKSVGYNGFISSIFTNICTYNGALPQGGPCSPKLANLSTWTLDNRIQGFVGIRGINYSRYADDLTFSGLNPVKFVKIIPRIKAIIESEDFKVNSKKTRIAGSARAKIITGLILSKEAFGIGKQKYKLLRSKVHHLTLPEQQENTTLLYHVEGWISYIHSVDKDRYTKLGEYINTLAAKHPSTLVAKLAR